MKKDYDSDKGLFIWELERDNERDVTVFVQPSYIEFLKWDGIARRDGSFLSRLSEHEIAQVIT